MALGCYGPSDATSEGGSRASRRDWPPRSWSPRKGTADYGAAEFTCLSGYHQMAARPPSWAAVAHPRKDSGWRTASEPLFVVFPEWGLRVPLAWEQARPLKLFFSLVLSEEPAALCAYGGPSSAALRGDLSRRGLRLRLWSVVCTSLSTRWCPVFTKRRWVVLTGRMSMMRFPYYKSNIFFLLKENLQNVGEENKKIVILHKPAGLPHSSPNYCICDLVAQSYCMHL